MNLGIPIFIFCAIQLVWLYIALDKLGRILEDLRYLKELHK